MSFLNGMGSMHIQGWERLLWHCLQATYISMLRYSLMLSFQWEVE